MDTSDRNIRFDADGYCNHCRAYFERVRSTILPPREAAGRLAGLVREMQAAGRGRPYDCVAGLSGGMDSSYVALLAKRLGLRTLLVHLDNGWDSELAVKNIENIVKKTGFDYFNHVVDWEEFKDLQLAYLRASVVDVEAVTDHAISALLYRKAGELKIRHILGGTNYRTEWIMPREGWSFPEKSFDVSNLRAIHRRFGTVPLRTYPTLGLHKWYHYANVRGVRTVELLNDAGCAEAEMRGELEREFGWRAYGPKHTESIFTKFYQRYILPRKFGIDKRRGHLSSLVCSGQITREAALAAVGEELYREEELRSEYEYVLKKLGCSPEEFERIMALPVVSHYAFPTDRQSSFMAAAQLLMRVQVRFLRLCGALPR